MANHLTPTELADELNMKRREVISKCMEMGVPIFNGRIDKTLFVSSLRQLTEQAKQPQAARLSGPLGRARATRRDSLLRQRRIRRRARERSRRRREPMETATVEPRPATGVASSDDRRPASRSPSASTAPSAAIMYKDEPVPSWVSKTYAEVGEIVARPLARPDRPRDREGRQGLDPRQHPARVDLLRLRGAHGRRDGRPDLPDQLARGVPVRARELRRQGRDRRGRRAAREDPRGPRPLPEARARDPA